MKKFKQILAIIMAVSAGLTMTSCSTMNDSMDKAESNAGGYFEHESSELIYDTSYDMEFGYTDEIISEESYPSTSYPSKENSTSQSSNDLKNRKIIKNASLTFETKTYDQFMKELPECLVSYGGYIEASDSSGASSYSSRRNASFVARVPADRYEAFMNAVGEIGTLTYKSEDSTDVTSSYVDTESRIKALRKEYEVLMEILDKANKLDDVLQIQSRITEVTYQIESFESQLRKYDSLISYCTIRISVREVEREVQNVEVMSFGEKVTHGLSETFYDISEDLSGFALWFIVSLPYIVIWAVIIFAAVLILRVIAKRAKRRREKKKIDELCRNINETTNGTQSNG